jgi:hypothetical protein
MPVSIPEVRECQDQTRSSAQDLIARLMSLRSSSDRLSLPMKLRYSSEMIT